MKKSLALLLTIALAFLLATPAFAVSWDEFAITKQPEDLTVAYGENAMLRIEVDIPDGAQEEYLWWRVNGENRSDTLLSGASGPALAVIYIPEDENFFDWLGNALHKATVAISGTSAEYYCVVICRETDEKGNVAESESLRSDTVTVAMEKGNVWQQALGYLSIPFLLGAQFLMPITWLTGFLAVPFLPVIYPLCVIVAAIQMIRRL